MTSDPVTTPASILLFHPGQSTFVAADIEMLCEIAPVKTFAFDTSGHPFYLLSSFVHQLYWCMKHMRTSRGIVIWFADHHAFFPVLLANLVGIKSYIILGGFESNHLPEYNYGLRQSRWRSWMARVAMHRATLLLPVTQKLMSWKLCWGGGPVAQGLNAVFPSIKTPFEEMPTGYDPAVFNGPTHERPLSVLAVASIGSMRTAAIKGVDLFFATAKQLPDVAFTLVGVSDIVQNSLIQSYGWPENIRFFSKLPLSEIIKFYRNNSVLLHLSRTEGLANVILEAQLCGCIPLVSPNGGNPDAVSFPDMVVDRPKPEQIAESLQRIHHAYNTRRSEIQRSVADNFHRNRRLNHWKELFEVR